MWELDHKEGWVLKNWFFRTVVREKTPESPLDSKEIKPFNSKGNQPWIFVLRTDAEAEAPILWLPNAKSRLTGKDLDAGEDWRQKEKRMIEDEMRRGRQRMRWQMRYNITNSMDMNLSKVQEIMKDRKVWRAAVHGVAKSWTRFSHWTTTVTEEKGEIQQPQPQSSPHSELKQRAKESQAVR